RRRGSSPAGRGRRCWRPDLPGSTDPARAGQGRRPLGRIVRIAPFSQLPGVAGAWKTILRIVVVGVNSLWLHFFASVVILPISFTRSPAFRSSRPTLPSPLASARPKVTCAFLTLYALVLPLSPAPWWLVPLTSTVTSPL